MLSFHFPHVTNGSYSLCKCQVLYLPLFQKKSPKTSTSGTVPEGSFQLNLLKRCSPLVRKCYGCQGVLKLRRGEEFFIPDPPEDLVIVTSMRRSFWQNDEQKTGRLGMYTSTPKSLALKGYKPSLFLFWWLFHRKLNVN